MTPLRVLIVDDEALARRRLATILRQLPGNEIAGEAGDGETALRLIGEVAPDVVLLDVRMPGLSGFDVLRALSVPRPPVIIFVSAFNHYAVKAFEVRAVDYVLKPVAFDRLAAALDRARQVLEADSAEQRIAEMAAVLDALRRSEPEPMPADTRYETEIWVQRRAEFRRVPVGTIDWIQAERDYVQIHAEGQSYLVRETIGGLADRLDPADFVRVHRSAIARRDRVTAVQQAGYGALRVLLSNGVSLRVGRTYARQVRGLISKP